MHRPSVHLGCSRSPAAWDRVPEVFLLPASQRTGQEGEILPVHGNQRVASLRPGGQHFVLPDGPLKPKTTSCLSHPPSRAADGSEIGAQETGGCPALKAAWLWAQQTPSCLQVHGDPQGFSGHGRGGSFLSERGLLWMSSLLGGPVDIRIWASSIVSSLLDGKQNQDWAGSVDACGHLGDALCGHSV